MIEYYTLSLFAAYCFGAFFYWLTHRKPKEEMKPPSDKDEAIKATAQFYKDLDAKKGYVHAFESVRNNPHRQIPKPYPEKMAELRRKALNSF